MSPSGFSARLISLMNSKDAATSLRSLNWKGRYHCDPPSLRSLKWGAIGEGNGCSTVDGEE